MHYITSFFLMKIRSLHWNGAAYTQKEKLRWKVAGEYQMSESPFIWQIGDSLMSEYPWHKTNITFTWLSCLYSPFKQSLLVLIKNKCSLCFSSFSEKSLLKVRLSPFPPKKCFICFNDSLSKMMKNTFYFILKAFFVLKTFTLLVLTFLACRKNSLIKKVQLISKFMTSQPG